jgi:inhibitor of KinA sporulation pathway (predicted exonuclease)
LKLIIDLEATCEENNKTFYNEIIEIGCCLTNGEFKPIDIWWSFVKPTINPKLSVFCQKLTSIEQKQVDNAQTLNYVINNMTSWLMSKNLDYDKILFCSWGDYDKNQFQRECNRKNVIYPFKNHLNVKNYFAEKFSVKPCGVQKALALLNMKFEGTHHRGKDDAVNIARICNKIGEFK